MTKLPAAGRPRLTLEDYVLFFTTRSGRDLTVDQLNQVGPSSICLSAPMSAALLTPPAGVADPLHARLQEVLQLQQAGDRRRAQLARPTTPAPRHSQHQRRGAPAGRRGPLRGPALHGGREARHPGPRLARVPHRLRPLRPRRGDLLLLRAARHHPPGLRGRRPARLPSEHTQRLLQPASRGARRGGDQEAGPEGPGEGGDQEEGEAHEGAAQAPVHRGPGHSRRRRRRPGQQRRHCLCCVICSVVD
uniref:DUF7787 domain-containing protein n=1 Tax=Aegilops tauschii subsp. strangulata TaxID=200361 RepID=A0A453I882_AEGTS